MKGSCLLTPAFPTAPLVGVVPAGPLVQKLTLRCTAATASQRWAATLKVTAATTGDPTVGNPGGAAAPGPFALSYDGTYTTRS